jgi:hypothetical protein
MRRLFPACAVALTLFVPTAAAPAPPALRISGATVEATAPDGAEATYDVKAFDPDTAVPLAATCDTPIGTAGTGSFSVSGQYPLGTTTVTCETTTTAGVTVTRSASIVVQDTTPPTVSAPGDVAVTTTNAGGTAVTYSPASATDVVDGSVPATCTPASGSTFASGVTTVTCSATDTHGNTGAATFMVTVTVVDTTPPSLSVPSDITLNTESASGVIVTYVATATDNLDGAVVPSCSPSSGASFPVGTTQVTCTATDSHGNSTSAGFNVTVVLVDTTAPALTVPGDFTVETTSASGATVTYTATATDALDGSVTPACAPPSGATFPLGATAVTCTATDAHGNSAQKPFTVTVVLVDKSPPAFSNVPSAIRREADGPRGAVATYALPSAVDGLDGPVPVTCTPASGAVFRLGSTTVLCTAVDSHGNSATTSFSVTIIDSTPPRVSGPPNSLANATEDAGIPATEPVVVAFLQGASASDLVDSQPTVTNDAPSLFPVGTTAVTFTARDASGNTARATATLTVRPKPPPGTPQPPPPQVDRTPPEDVARLKAKVGNRLVRLSWENPKADDFDHVEITRSGADPGAPATLVYRGSGTSYADRSVSNGVEYRYLVVSVDHAGNASDGVVAAVTPARPLLVSPPDGARMTRPPKLTWVATASARYYNVQLFLGATKVLSVWPSTASFLLKKKWTYGGKQYRLTPATYRWYVWPGFGNRKDARYGPLIGTSSFQIIP